MSDKVFSLCGSGGWWIWGNISIQQMSLLNFKLLHYLQYCMSSCSKSCWHLMRSEVWARLHSWPSCHVAKKSRVRGHRRQSKVWVFRNSHHRDGENGGKVGWSGHPKRHWLSARKRKIYADIRGQLWFFFQKVDLFFVACFFAAAAFWKEIQARFHCRSCRHGAEANGRRRDECKGVLWILGNSHHRHGTDGRKTCGTHNPARRWFSHKGPVPSVCCRGRLLLSPFCCCSCRGKIAAFVLVFDVHLIWLWVVGW